MADIISEIAIVAAEVSSDTLTLEWELNGGTLFEYTGTYQVEITENGKAFNSYPIVDKEGYLQNTHEFKGYTCGKIYQVRLCGGGVSSETVRLVVDRFTNVCGEFDGERFYFHWGVTSDAIPGGYCTISDGDKSFSIRVNPFYGTMVTEQMYFSEGKTVHAVFTPSDGEICEGPRSDELVFYPDGVRITSACITSGEDAETVTLTLKDSSPDVVGVSMIFQKNGNALYETSAVQKNRSGEICSVSANIPHCGIMPELLRQCVVRGIYINGNARTTVCTKFSEISLAAPEVVPTELGTPCKADIYISSEIPPIGFQLSDGSLATDRHVCCPSDFIVRARYDCGGMVRKGPESVGGFRECYYTDGETVYYRKTSFEETGIDVPVEKEWFVRPLKEQIKSGGLALTMDDSGGTLSIKTTEAVKTEDYNTYLAEIMDYLTPQGFYAITEIILRMGAYRQSDTSYFHCQYQPAEHRVDVRPGLFLRTETAAYMPQYDAKVKNSAGFVWTNAAECEVSFSSRSGFLEFNSFAAGMMSTMNVSPSVDGTQIIYAAGIEDLLRPAVRQPYFRLLYPSAIPTQDTAVPYPADNVILMAADSYGKLQAACDAIKSDPSAINSLSVPVVVFRGRGMLSLFMEICVNGRSCHVPVGSSLGQVLYKYGIASTEHVRLYRRSFSGRELQVFGSIRNIPLIHGDRIEG